MAIKIVERLYNYEKRGGVNENMSEEEKNDQDSLISGDTAKKALVAGGAGLAGSAALMANKDIRKKTKKSFKAVKEEVKGQAKDQAKDVVDDMPKTKNAAAASVVGKKFYDTFEQVREAKDDIKENFEGVGDKLKDKAEGFKDSAQDAKGKLKDQVENAKEEIKDNELTNPGGSGSSDDGIKKASDLKGYSDVKGYSEIKGASSIKGVNQIKKP